jgi:hypothetical protein
LNRSSVNLEEDFFDVGGNPVLARELFTDISRTCSQEISPLMICQAPTILALAALLEQPTPRQLSPLVLLKPGSEKPPVFMTHGIGGSMVDFFQLARKMETPHPIYGLQAKGLDGVGEAVQASRRWPNSIWTRSGRFRRGVRTTSSGIPWAVW